jgi:opacity protein-like surface antigen
MKKIFAIAASALVFAAPAMAQQGPSDKDIAAFAAINLSTVGAPALATNTLGAAGGIGWHLQYGRMSWGEGTDVSQNSFAAGFDVNLGRGRFGVTAGYMTFSCPAPATCDGHLIIGSRYSNQLTGGTFQNGGRWQMGLEGEVGVGLPEDERAIAIAVGMPVKFTFGRQAKISPFVAPSFAHGSYKDAAGTSEGALKFMLGAGVGVAMRNGMGINVGMRKVFIDEGETQYGLGFTIRPRSRR